MTSLKDVDPIQLAAWAESGVITHGEYVRIMGERHTPEWTEGVCEDGAAILRDGQMVTISELLATLNSNAAEITRLRELTQWMPIETAPKDGRFIIGLGVMSDEVGQEPEVVHLRFDRVDWVDHGDYIYDLIAWLPLPPPPEKAK